MKKPYTLALAVLALGAVLGFFGWAFYAMGGVTGLTGGSTAIAVMIVGGVFFTGALGVGLMWLAFYSSRKGYDKAPEFGSPEDQP
jgi:hypothetical protein